MAYNSHVAQHICCILHFVGRLGKAVLADFSIKRAAVYSQNARSFCLVPICPVQDCADLFPSARRNVFAGRPFMAGMPSYLFRYMVKRNDLVTAEDKCVFYGVFQLSDISPASDIP